MKFIIYFSLPKSIPLIIFFCKKYTVPNIGIVATIIVALIIPHNNPLSNLKVDNATGKVTASFLVIIKANMYSVHVKNIQNKLAVIIPPILKGNIILVNK